MMRRWQCQDVGIKRQKGRSVVVACPGDPEFVTGDLVNPAMFVADAA
jgi:hypothetical protein